MKYECELCGFVYDEEQGDAKQGIAPGTTFAELPEEYECVRCGYKKEAFNPVRTSDHHEHMRIQTHIRTSMRR